MMSHQHEHRLRSPPWLPARPSTARRRLLVFFGLLFLGALVFGSIWLISEETMRMERRNLDRRQFMLSGVLSEQSRVAAQPVALNGDTVKHESGESFGASSMASQQPTASDTPQQSSTGDIAGLAGGASTPRADDITETNPPQDSSADLVEELSEALEKVIGESASSFDGATLAEQQSPGSTSTNESPTVSSQTPPVTDLESTSSLAPVSIAVSTSDSVTASILVATSASASTSTLAPTSTQSMAPTTDTTPQLISSSVVPSDSGEESGTTTDAAASTPSSLPSSSLTRKPNYSNGLFGELMKLALVPRASADGFVARIPSTHELSAKTNHSPSLLSCLSNIVAQLAGVDVGAAARLTDAVLGALSVDTSAVASIIPKVAGKASVQTADVIPFILPAVAKALGAPLDQNPSFNYSDHVGTRHIIVQQGAVVINEISNIPENSVGPALKAVLSQVAGVVYSMAGQLNESLCALSQTVDDNTIEIVIPCDSAGLNGAASTTGIMTPSVPTIVGGVTIATASWSVITLQPPGTYGLPDSPTPTATADDASVGVDSGADNQINSMSLPDSYGPDTSQAIPPAASETSRKVVGCSASRSTSSTTPCASVADASSISDQSSYPLVLSSTSIQCQDCPSSCTVGATRPSDASAGPCPGSGFSCADCPDGWFCPPLQTPAQTAPCGKGWPCYDCKSGWFCAPESDLPPAPTPSASSTDCPSSPAEATQASTGKTDAGGDTDTDSAGGTDEGGTSAGIPASWTYLGCFQDAISRTLLGAKPTDYLRGNMSRAACADHCTSRGYSFAGTECGHECWCGASIRDDAVRLPESYCGTPCQGAETELCGGNWTISVFMCSDGDDGSAQGQPAAVQSTPSEPATLPDSARATLPPSYDSMAQLLAVGTRWT